MRFAAARPWRLCLIGAGLVAGACSLVVGDLPAALPEGGPLAGEPGQATGGSTGSEGGKAPSTPEAGTAGAVSDDACDADGDRYPAEGMCGGEDCDDSDERVHPDQSAYFPGRQDKVGFDYDCSGGPEQQQQEPIACTAVSLEACDTKTMGFLGSLPKCGEMGRWGTCVKAGTAPLQTCEENEISTEQMRCH